MRSDLSLAAWASRVAAIVVGTAAIMEVGGLSAQTSDGTPVPWRVECNGDGKTLGCQAIQQVAQRDARQQVTPLLTMLVHYVPEGKTAVTQILLPLGLSLTDPISIKVDNGTPERQPIQTCNNQGCLVTMSINDKLLAAMRSGTDLKITVQDINKKPVEIALPLLGFGVAFDKTK
jgi:invasion protein IalB